MIYVINFKKTGEILTPDSIKEYWKNYGNNELHGWRAPKKVYYTLGQARSGFAHLPDQLKPHLEISEFTKSKSVIDGADLMITQKENKDKKKAETVKKRAKWEAELAMIRLEEAKKHCEKFGLKVQ